MMMTTMLLSATSPSKTTASSALPGRSCPPLATMDGVCSWPALGCSEHRHDRHYVQFLMTLMTATTTWNPAGSRGAGGVTSKRLCLSRGHSNSSCNQASISRYVKHTGTAAAAAGNLQGPQAQLQQAGQQHLQTYQHTPTVPCRPQDSSARHQAQQHSSRQQQELQVLHQLQCAVLVPTASRATGRHCCRCCRGHVWRGLAA